MLTVLPCLDSDALAAQRRRELDTPKDRARALGLAAVEAARQGFYLTASGRRVEIGALLAAARGAKVSIPGGARLPRRPRSVFPETVVQVTNETTIGAARRLLGRGFHPLALNFANGVHPGGGFLQGASAQEEVLCRSSALYITLEDDPLYEAHRERDDYESTDWAILSPDVPFFRTDDGTALEEPWLLSVITCAAPVAQRVGQPRAGDLLQARIRRVLAIAMAWGYESLVLGAWGCGAFGNDPARTARDFRSAIEGPCRNAFREVVFAITDWSPERRFLGPFRDTFAPG